MSYKSNKRKHSFDSPYPKEAKEDQEKKQKYNNHQYSQKHAYRQSEQSASHKYTYQGSNLENKDNNHQRSLESPQQQQKQQQHLSNQVNIGDKGFVYYLDQLQRKNINDNMREYERCHWFELFGRCDTTKCDMKHNFTPTFKCTRIERYGICSLVLPNYIQSHLKDNPGFYSCDNHKKIHLCHDYTYFGLCYRNICKSAHKEIQEKCIERKKPCQICPNRQREIQELEFKKAKPQPIYYLDQLKKNNIKKYVVPDEEKCHWYDLFGRCDANKCKLRHDFLPLFKCQNIEKNKYCNTHLPEYIKLVQAQSKQEIFNCNNKELYSSLSDCNDYKKKGECTQNICKFYHKKAYNIPTKQEIIAKTIKMEDTLTKKFIFNGNNLKAKLLEVHQQYYDMKNEQNSLDLMFMIECTKEMQQWIQFIQNNISQIVQTIKQQNPHFSCRVSFRGYGNRNQVQVFDYSNNLDKFTQFVRFVKGTNDAGIPQDLISSLKEGLYQPTTSKAVLVILFQMSSILEDKTQNKFEENIAKYAEKNIFFSHFLMEHKTRGYPAQETYNRAYKEYEKNGKKQLYYGQYFQNTDMNESKVQEIIIQLCQGTISDSIRNSKQIKEKNLSDYKLNQFGQRQLNNYEVPMNNILVYSQDISNLNSPIIFENPSLFKEEFILDYQIKIQKKKSEDNNTVTYFGRDTTLDKDIIIKADKYIYKDPKQNWLAMFESQRKQVVAFQLIDKFRNLVLPFVQNIGSLPLFFKNKAAQLCEQYFYIETYLKDLESQQESQQQYKDEYEQLLECLPHFTFQYTEGNLMIENIQGTIPVVTDLHIHSSNKLEYGTTNQGQGGMASYFVRHTCNHFCQSLKLVSIHESNNIPINYDYYTDIYQSSKEALQKLDQYQTIKMYEDQKFFCGFCGHLERKEWKKKNESIKAFSNSICDSCSREEKDIANIKCFKCKCQISTNELLIKNKLSEGNEECNDCLKLAHLEKIEKLIKKNISI